MRSHSHLGGRFSGSDRWNFSHGTRGEVTNIIRNPEGSEHVWTAFSHSGKERNRTFLNLGDGSFADASGVSGADTIADSRCFVCWDFNRDGWVDIAVVNANRPLLQLFANRRGEVAGGNRSVALRLTGANRSSEPSATRSNRDAIGAKVVLECGGQTIVRVLSCGEGFASQNSKTLLVGIGGAEAVDSARVVWPSGGTQDVGRLEAGDLALIDEAGNSVELRPYRAP